MAKRGRPRGSTREPAVLAPLDIRKVLRHARQRGRLEARAEVVLALTLGLGLSASELVALDCADVYDSKGRVRTTLAIRAPSQSRGRRRVVALASPYVKSVLSGYGEQCIPWRATASNEPLFVGQKCARLSTNSMARFLTALYREAGISGATSGSGRRTLIIRLAEAGITPQTIAHFLGRSDVRSVTSKIVSDEAQFMAALRDAI